MTSDPISLLAAALLVAAFAALGACNSGPKYYPVSGTVTFNGEPVADGNITFAPEDTGIAPVQGAIKDGRYELKAAEGKNKVQVTASKIRPGGAKGAGGEPVPEDYIPEQ